MKKKDLETAEFFAMRVGEAYMYHAFSLHRRPVYRHEAGDMLLTPVFLVEFMEDHLSRKFATAERRARFYRRLLKPLPDAHDSRMMFCMGILPELNRRGVRYMNVLINTSGDTLADMNFRDSAGLPGIPKSTSEVVMTRRQRKSREEMWLRPAFPDFATTIPFETDLPKERFHDET